MHIHILGICGTFMGGLALLAKEAGHQVSGCDTNVYPPMSTQLEEQGIQLIQGFGAEQLQLKPDVFVIGNVVSRGNPLIEAILNAGHAYVSGPQWIAEHILHDRWVLAVAGTHGKTTTSSMLAWILEDAGYQPGFLIGGIPLNFGISARLGNKAHAPFFVIEADEYDTAFFDKRSKFLHYHPRTLILNNLEYDHADIFPDLAAIETQFHHLVRTVPGQGRILVNAREATLAQVLQKGCWSEVEYFVIDTNTSVQTGWAMQNKKDIFNASWIQNTKEELTVPIQWELSGVHQQMNGLAAIGAARHVGINPEQSAKALATFQSVKRRMEVRGVVNEITVYDDFAHHPTAIELTIAGLRSKVGSQRILAVLEPRSNTMKLGAMKDALAPSLKQADLAFVYGEKNDHRNTVQWDLAHSLRPLGDKVLTTNELDQLIDAIVAKARPGDHILVMSNGGFGGVHQKILERLK